MISVRVGHDEEVDRSDSRTVQTSGEHVRVWSRIDEYGFSPGTHEHCIALPNIAHHDIPVFDVPGNQRGDSPEEGDHCEECERPAHLAARAQPKREPYDDEYPCRGQCTSRAGRQRNVRSRKCGTHLCNEHENVRTCPRKGEEWYPERRPHMRDNNADKTAHGCGRHHEFRGNIRRHSPH